MIFEHEYKEMLDYAFKTLKENSDKIKIILDSGLEGVELSKEAMIAKNIVSEYPDRCIVKMQKIEAALDTIIECLNSIENK